MSSARPLLWINQLWQAFVCMGGIHHTDSQPKTRTKDPRIQILISRTSWASTPFWTVQIWVSLKPFPRLHIPLMLFYHTLPRLLEIKSSDSGPVRPNPSHSHSSSVPQCYLKAQEKRQNRLGWRMICQRTVGIVCVSFETKWFLRTLFRTRHWGNWGQSELWTKSSFSVCTITSATTMPDCQLRNNKSVSSDVLVKQDSRQIA